MADKFPDANPGRQDSAMNGFTITPSDTVDLLQPTRGLYIGGAGNVNVIFAGDTAATLLIAPALGVPLPLRVKRVLAASTTATGIVGLY